MSGNEDEVNSPEIEEGIDIEGPEIPFALDDFVTQHPNGELRVEVDVGGKQKTVAPREILRFEEDLVDHLIEDKTDNNRKGANIPVKGPWIHGWIENNGPDYIANIFRNYQLFLKFVQGRTEQIENRGTVNRKPGTYDSTYTYILVLEKLGLVERFTRQEIPENEFDHPVPDSFQDRTFLRIVTPFEEEPEKWRNPYKHEYPKHFGDEEVKEEIDDNDDDIDRAIEDIEDDLEEEPDEEDNEEQEVDESINTIDDVSNPSAFVESIESNLEELLEETLDDAPVPSAAEGYSPEDFEIGRISAFGVWVEDATQGQDELSLLIELINNSGKRNAPFINNGLAARYENRFNQNNTISDTFPSYEIRVAFTDGYLKDLKNVVSQTQEEEIYYDVRNESFEEL